MAKRMEPSQPIVSTLLLVKNHNPRRFVNFCMPARNVLIVLCTRLRNSPFHQIHANRGNIKTNNEFRHFAISLSSEASITGFQSLCEIFSRDKHLLTTHARHGIILAQIADQIGRLLFKVPNVVETARTLLQKIR